MSDLLDHGADLWLDTCPFCDAPPGDPCIIPGSKVGRPPHKCRLVAEINRLRAHVTRLQTLNTELTLDNRALRRVPKGSGMAPFIGKGRPIKPIEQVTFRDPITGGERTHMHHPPKLSLRFIREMAGKYVTHSSISGPRESALYGFVRFLENAFPR